MNTNEILIKVNAAEVREFLSEMYPAFLHNNKIKTYLSVGRETLKADWFSGKGIFDKYRVDSRHFLSQKFFKEFHPHEIYANFAPERICAFAEQIMIKVFQAQEPIIDYRFKNPDNKLIALLREKMKWVPKSEGSHAHDAIRSLMQPPVTKSEDLNTAIRNYFKENQVLEKIGERITAEAQKLQPTVNVIKIGSNPEVKIEGKLHHAFNEALEMLRLESQLFIAGPAGTGKTTLGAQLAKALNLSFGHISCTAGMSEAHLLGRMDVSGNYIQAQFVEMFENGGVFLFDEVDAADANTMLIINSALANGYLSVPNRRDKQQAMRHKDFYCICAANTWGYGSNEYAGRNQLDAAFLDRFCGSKLFVDYDTTLEKAISSPIPNVAIIIWKIRDNVSKNKIRRVVSTRAIVSGVKAVSAGKTMKHFVDRFLTGWTDAEKQKALENVNLN